MAKPTHCSQKVLEHGMGSQFMWGWEGENVPRKPHMVELAKVIFVSLLGFENPTLFHIVQRWTSRILVLQLFVGFPMIAVHLNMLLPSNMTLAEHLIMPCEVFVWKPGILTPLTLKFCFSGLQLEGAGSTCLGFFGCGVFPGLFCSLSCTNQHLIFRF